MLLRKQRGDRSQQRLPRSTGLGAAARLRLHYMEVIMDHLLRSIRLYLLHSTAAARALRLAWSR
eukprot:1811844-Prymnesium_polylepis.1